MTATTPATPTTTLTPRPARHSCLRRAATLLALGLAMAPAAQAQPTPKTMASALDSVDALLGPQRGRTTLKPNERLQGVIEVDVGKGPVRALSVATLVDKDLGQQAAAKLNTAEGRKAVADGQARAGAIAGQGAAQRVTAAEVQATADFFAGKTMYSSQARRVDIIKQHVMSLAATGPDGSEVTLNLGLQQADLKLDSARLEFRPAGARVLDRFESDKKGPGAATVTIDKIERLGDKGFAISGSFKATQLQPGVLAKTLKGQTLPAISGRFAFSEVPLR